MRSVRSVGSSLASKTKYPLLSAYGGFEFVWFYALGNCALSRNILTLNLGTLSHVGSILGHMGSACYCSPAGFFAR